MNRRQLITLFGGTAAWPMVTHGQQLAIPLIGYLDPWSAEGHRPQLTAFLRGLNEVGFIESRNVRLMSLARHRHRLRFSRLRGHFEELTASDTLPD